MDDLRYPIGDWQRPEVSTAGDCAGWIDQIARAPSQLRAAVVGLDDRQLDTRYRPAGWTVRQVVHHIADSHLNSYMRFRLALTENRPTIRPYDEAAWAELPDANEAPVALSLDLLDALHRRWVTLVRTFNEGDFAREFVHPEMETAMRLDEALSSYAWHGRHHIAHITSLRDRENW